MVFLLFWAALSPGTVVYVPCHQPSVSASASAPVPFPSSLESLSPARSPASRQNLKPPAALFYIAASGTVHYRIRVSRCSLFMVIHCNTEAYWNTILILLMSLLIMFCCITLSCDWQVLVPCRFYTAKVLQFCEIASAVGTETHLCAIDLVIYSLVYQPVMQIIQKTNLKMEKRIPKKWNTV